MTRGKRSNRPRVSRKPPARPHRSRTQKTTYPPGPPYTMLFSGPEVKLLNISKGGVLLECEWRMSTAARLCLKLVTKDAVFMLKGRVLRSRALAPEGLSAPYQSVVAFDEDFLLLDDELSEDWIPAEGNKIPVESPPHRSAAGPAPVLAVTASAQCSGSEMRRILGIRSLDR